MKEETHELGYTKWEEIQVYVEETHISVMVSENVWKKLPSVPTHEKKRI